MQGGHWAKRVVFRCILKEVNVFHKYTSVLSGTFYIAYLEKYAKQQKCHKSWNFNSVVAFATCPLGIFYVVVPQKVLFLFLKSVVDSVNKLASYYFVGTFATYWGGVGASSTMQVSEIVEPRTTWNSPSWPSTRARGVTTSRWKTREWNPEVVEICKKKKLLLLVGWCYSGSLALCLERQKQYEVGHTQHQWALANSNVKYETSWIFNRKDQRI